MVQFGTAPTFKWTKPFNWAKAQKRIKIMIKPLADRIVVKPAEAEQKTVKVEAETKLIQAQNDAEIEITKASAEAEANRVIAESITEELIRMKEAEARLEHGWVTVQGADSVIADAKE